MLLLARYMPWIELIFSTEATVSLCYTLFTATPTQQRLFHDNLGKAEPFWVSVKQAMMGW